MEWWCDDDSTNHEALRFQTPEDYARHLTKDDNVSPSSADKQIVTAGRPSLTPFSCCPLCDFLPSESQYPITIAPNSMSGSLQQQRILQRHIANDLINIFLIALPERDDLSETNTDTDLAFDKRSTIHDQSDSSIKLDDTSKEQHLDSVNQTGHSDNIAQVSFEDTCDPEACNAIWQAVWKSFALRDSIRETYQGPEYDAVLFPFREQLNIEKRQSIIAGTYRTCWLVAEQVEAIIAQQLFDEGGHVLPKTVEDLSYTQGTIGGHKVLVVLPRSRFDNNPNTVLQSITSIFPDISLCLCIGLGFVPDGQNHDVRQTDVVISNQLVQWACLGDSRYPTKVNAKILAAHPILDTISKLKANLQEITPRVHQLSQLLYTKASNIVSISTKPTAGSGINNSDRSAKASKGYTMGQSSQQISGEILCGRIDELNKIDPKIRFGSIASIDQDLEGLLFQSDTAIQNSALCFERIHHQLTHSMPCIFIRGVHGYADNKQIPDTQGKILAMSVAAACSKEFLIHLSSSDIMLDFFAQRSHNLESLRFPGMNDQFQRISGAFSNTNSWFMKKIICKEWHEDVVPSTKRRIVNLCGGRATGKSTIMKFTVTHVEQYIPETIVISYFFGSSTKVLHESLTEMYRCLLFQLLSQYPEVQDLLDLPIFEENATGIPLENSETLLEMFRTAIARLKHRTIMCFIDAIDKTDEYGEQPNLRPIMKDPLFSATLSQHSRSPLFNPIKTSQSLVIDLDHNSDHSQNIRNYIHERVVSENWAQLIPQQFEYQLFQACRGGFLWIDAALMLMKQNYEISTIPRNLNSLFDLCLPFYSEQSWGLLEAGHIQVMKLLLSRNCLDFANNTSMVEMALKAAIERDDREMLRALLAQNHIPWIINSMYQLALGSAMDVGFVLLLLTMAIIINVPNSKSETALTIAVGEQKSIRIIRALLARLDVDSSASDSLGRTVLILAAASANSWAVKSLLAHLNIDVNIRDKWGRAALVVAADVADSKTVELLLAHPGIDVNIRDKWGRTALVVAAAVADSKTVELLLAHPNTDVNAVDDRHYNALMRVAMLRYRKGALGVVNLLLTHPAIDVSITDEHGDSPLSYLLEYFNAKAMLGIARLILNHPSMRVNLDTPAHRSLLRQIQAKNLGDLEKLMLARDAERRESRAATALASSDLKPE